MDTLLFACILMGTYLVLTLVAPRILHRPTFLIKHPRAALRLWLAALVLACSALVIALGVFIARALRHHIVHVEHHDIAGPLIDSILGWMAIAVIGIITFRLGVSATEIRTEYRATSDLLAPLISGATPISIGATLVWEVASLRPILAALPQARRIVISSTMLTRLNPEERLAAIAHEQSHLRHHHSRVLAIGALAEAVAPAFLAGQRLAQSSRIATELIADDDAASQCGAQATASALLAAYPDDESVADRAARLLAR